MVGKYCPKCKRRMRKALRVIEMIVKWSDEGSYRNDYSKIDCMKTYEKCLACGNTLIWEPEKSTKIGNKNQEEFKDIIPDEEWERVHKLYAENFKIDPVDTERHLNFRMQDATLISSRDEVERQHRAWAERQRTKDLLREKIS